MSQTIDSHAHIYTALCVCLSSSWSEFGLNPPRCSSAENKLRSVVGLSVGHVLESGVLESRLVAADMHIVEKLAIRSHSARYYYWWYLQSIGIVCFVRDDRVSRLTDSRLAFTGTSRLKSA